MAGTQQRRMFLIIAVLALSLVATGSVAAHARPKSSDPADKATIQSAPAQVTIIFTEETSPTKSDGSVSDANTTIVSTGFKVDLNDRTKMTIALKPNLPGGNYFVHWKTFTEEDSGVAEGVLSFTVQAVAQAATAPVATSAAATSAPTSASTAAPATSTAAPTATTLSAAATRAPTAQAAATGTGGATSAPTTATLPATGRATDPSTTRWRYLLVPIAGSVLLLIGLVLIRKKAHGTE